jgi:hypothetical protein
LVSSLARPDANLTGVSILSTELDGKRQEILIDAVPGLQRMAALADPNATSALRLQALQKAARSRNVELSVHRVTKSEDIVAAVDAAKASGAAALNVLSSPVQLWVLQNSLIFRMHYHASLAPPHGIPGRLPNRHVLLAYSGASCSRHEKALSGRKLRCVQGLAPFSA